MRLTIARPEEEDRAIAQDLTEAPPLRVSPSPRREALATGPGEGNGRGSGQNNSASCISTGLFENGHGMVNALSIDLEDWYQANFLSEVIPFEKWGNCRTRIEESVEEILRILDDNNTRATFFVLGWIAERRPRLIAKVHELGHEIALHGYCHRLVYEQRRDEFAEDIKRSVGIVEDIVRDKVLGYRAPFLSINEQTQWALEILADSGIRYDSSIRDIGRICKGCQEMGNNTYKLQHGMIEIPPTSIRIGTARLPVGAGFFIRALPYSVTRSLIARGNKKGKPANVYFHPWEIDLDYPHLKIALLKRFVQYHNLGSAKAKFELLLRDFEFSTFKDTYLERKG